MKESSFQSIQEGSVKGFLHAPNDGLRREFLVLTHGAGGNCRVPMLVALAEAFCRNGVTVLRCDLPYRQRRASGPPSPAGASQDRAGLRDAVLLLRRGAPDAVVFLGGHSYGGRQASMLAAEEPDLAKALVLLSYPLHAPHKPGQLRTAHFPQLQTPTLFVHGERDPFGSVDELRTALPMIPAPTEVTIVSGAGHDLKGGKFDLEAGIVFPLRALKLRADSAISSI